MFLSNPVLSMQLVKMFQNSRQKWIIFTTLTPFDENNIENDS